MNKDEIIDMARQAGFVDYELDDGTTDAVDKRYEAFAKLVAEHEREECAKRLDAVGAAHCADNIRLRAQA